ncbi:hypothetical protein ACFSR7_25515 [Cohnella sp. GCM10020058]|uniref:hypothetical protein n=1 Tax=Cohnella sp. GCM10020058 TaxID=3317330 RepID=UPI00363C9991
MKTKTQILFLIIIAFFLVTACSSKKTINLENASFSPSPQQNNTDSPSSTLAEPTEPSASPTPAEVKQEPFLMPEGYQVIQTSSFKAAIPKEWTYEKGSSSDLFIFKKGDKEIGQTEVLGWFDSTTWKDMKPNHSEQNDFQEVEEKAPITGLDIHNYKIQLTHTKPAAQQDPDWSYKETRWYVTIKEQERSYGFYFSSDDVDESVMKSIVSTFRLI